MNIFITGAAGYIGSILCEFALDKGYHVVFFDNYIPTDESFYKLLNHKNLSILKGDLKDANEFSKVLEKCDIVIHLAGIADGVAGKINPQLTRIVNIDYTKSFILKCKTSGIKRFLFASTMGVYGNLYKSELHEDLALNPIDPYSESKSEIEKYLLEINDSNFTTCALRIAMVYGESISKKKGLLVNTLVTIAKEKKELIIQGGNQKRPQIHVKDVANIFLDLIEIDAHKISGKSYNLVESNPSIQELGNYIKSFLPETEIKIIESREKEDTFSMSCIKLANELNLYPKITLIKGIEELIKINN